MNISEANFIIHSINGVVEMLIALNQDIEQKAWDSFEDHVGMGGERRTTAHSLADPTPTPTVALQPELPTPEPAAEPVVSLEDVRGVLAVLLAQGHTEKVRELIVAAGADKLSVVDPSKFGWLLERAKEIADSAV